MSTSEPEVPGPVFIVDKPRAKVDRLRLVYRIFVLFLGAGLIVMALYGLNARSLGNYRLFNKLAALSPLVVFIGIEAWLASRKSVRDRVYSVQLLEDHALIRFVYRDGWKARYSDIADILVRYRRRYAHYDHMCLLLTMRQGGTLWLGRCRGEIMESLARELRERCSGAKGSSVGRDREYRLKQRRELCRSGAIFFTGVMLLLLVRLVAVEQEYSLYRRLNREGVEVQARMTTQFPRPTRVRVFYLFQTPNREFEKGYADLPVDPNRKLRQGSTIPVRYLPDDVTVHRGVGSFPRYSRLWRWLSWAAVGSLAILATGCLRGWDALVFRGTFRLVRGGELVEDSLGSSRPRRSGASR